MLNDSDQCVLVDQSNRMHLTMAWLELEALISAGVDVRVRSNGVWRCYPQPIARGQERQISNLAYNALRAALGPAGRHPVNGKPAFTPQSVQAAKRLVVTALSAYQRVAFA